MKQSRPVEGGNKVSDAPREKQGNRKGAKSSEPSKNTNDGARAKQATLKTVLGEALGYGPALSEHIILDAGDQVPEGYILMQNKIFGKDCRPSQPDRGSQIYDEFCPILLNQFKSREFVKFETFDAASDEFYSKIEGQRSEQQQKAKEVSAMQKLSKICMDQLLACNYVIVTWAASNENLANASVVVWACYGHSLFTCQKENRVHTLKKEDDRCIKMAELIEYNLEDVDAAILAVRVALANGMNWEDLARMVKEKKKSGNPVAGLIDKLYLERNCMTLLLSNNLDEMDDDEKTLHVDKVEVDLALSAHANARQWYEQKKRQENKREKTIIAHEKLLKLLKRRLASSFHRNG
ncbi:Nuclear export mediator factor Nemf [Vitis vinifera]|uniref:Nuclear export mediator factor Nemf n=1 Tax=Vitis vinifera TaxID=29760 RepID=A0A438FXL2_VITVI|nr:Nuclear export mediator factor Nemf [Vitis vinifera]